MKSALVCGAGGFIGSHLVRRLKDEGFHVTGIDLKYPEFSPTAADIFLRRDLQDSHIPMQFDEVYQLAADMGGAGYIFTGENDANIMLTSAAVNINVIKHVARMSKFPKRRIFYSSSACMYPASIQDSRFSRPLRESDAYPAEPDSEYGWEKLFSERLYAAASRNSGIDVRVARYHNIFGPEGTWRGGREKAPAALCRKIAGAPDGGTIDIWGDGMQVRSFLYIDECIEGTLRLMRSDCSEPLNIGSSELVSINDLAGLIAEIAGKKIHLNHIPGPQGVRGRSSDNTMIEAKLGWKPTERLVTGLEKTYAWVEQQVRSQA